MKHNVWKINKYRNVKGREEIEWTLHNKVTYSIVNVLGNIRGFIKVNSNWEYLDSDEAQSQYDFILNVISFEMQKNNG